MSNTLIRSFNLPDFQGRYLGGNGNGYVPESLPNITGTYTDEDGFNEQNIGTGAFKQINSVETGNYVGAVSLNRKYSIMEFDASRSSSTYQNGAKVKPDTLLCNLVIKY